MEFENLPYATNGRQTSRSEPSNTSKKYLQGRNLPVYLLENGPLPGIPKGQKVRKKVPKIPLAGGGGSQKSYPPIDTTRTDFSKMASDAIPPLAVDTGRTDDSGLDFSMATPLGLSSSRQTPHWTDELAHELRDLNMPIPIAISHGLHPATSSRAMTQSEPRISSEAGWKVRRGSKPRAESKVTESAPPSRRESRTDLEPMRRTIDNADYEPNPDVAPYQPANFMSSTILKKVPIPKRHLDTFGGYEYNFMGKRGVMLHTDRYQVDFIKSLDGMTQRERLQAGLNYVEAMRGTKRRREMIPHRAQLDLIMGGKQIEFEERFYLSRELQKLKALAMPQNAKDLFHGRGIHLPSHHMSLKPRYRMPNDIEEEVMASAPSSLQSLPKKGESVHEFPRVDRDPTFMGRGSQMRTRSTINRHSQLPSIRGTSEAVPRISITSERRTVTCLSARLGLTSRLHRDVTSLSRSHTMAPPPTRDLQDGHQRMLARGKGESVTPKRTMGPVEVPGRDSHRTAGADSAGGDSLLTTARTEPEVALTSSAAIPKAVPEEGLETSLDPALGNGPSNAPPPESRESKARPLTEEGLHSTTTTPNPLKAAELITSVPQDEQEELRQTFQRLDTDMDGHIKYTQLKTQLPKAFNKEQERFIEEVYNLTNSITFFGVDEFMAMDRLYKTVESLTGRAREAYEGLDFGSLPQELLKYVGLFDEADTGNRSSLPIDALQRILSTTVSSSLTSDPSIWDEVLDSVSIDYATKVSKINYIAHIPLFLRLEKDHK